MPRTQEETDIVEAGTLLRKTGPTTAVYSLRVNKRLWLRAKKQASQEGLAINRVITLLLNGYSTGLYLLPARVPAEEEDET